MTVTTSPKGYFVYLDYTVVIFAITCNIIVLTAVVRGRFNLSGYRRFLISLTASDLYVCTVNVMTMIFQIYTAQNSSTQSSSTITLCGAKVLKTLQLAGFFASLLNIVGMSIDHFFGIVYPMNYHSLMNKHAARSAVAVIWVVSFSLAFLDIPINVVLYREMQNSNVDVATIAPPFNRSIGISTPSFENEFNQHIAINNRTKTTIYKRLKRDINHSSTVMSPMITLRESKTTYSYEDDDADSDSTDFLDIFLKNLKSYNRTTPTNTTINTNKTATPLTLDQLFNDLRENERHIGDRGIANMCTFFSISKMWFEMCVIVLALLCFAFLTICYGIILKKVSERLDSGKKTTRKLIFTTVILLSAFMICWLPFMIFEFSMLLFFQQRSGSEGSPSKSDALLTNSFFLNNVLNSLLMCHPLVDPIIYAARIPAVQQSILVYCAIHFQCCSECIFRLLSSDNRRSLASKYPRLAKIAGVAQLFYSTSVDVHNSRLGRLNSTTPLNAENAKLLANTEHNQNRRHSTKKMVQFNDYGGQVVDDKSNHFDSPYYRHHSSAARFLHGISGLVMSLRLLNARAVGNGKDESTRQETMTSSVTNNYDGNSKGGEIIIAEVSQI